MSDFSFLLNRQTNDGEIGTRTRLVTTMNRYMADRPDAVQAMVMSDLSNEELIDTAGSMYAAQVGDGMMAQLQGMSPGTQRAVFGQLTKQQQMALGQLGYAAPVRDDGFGFGDIVKPIAGGIGAVVGGIGNVVKPVAEPALEGLGWVGNWPGHLYRTIRLQDGWGQVAAGVFGVVGGIAALSLAPVTGGGSLMAFGAFGLGALGAGSAAAAIVNPGDWMRAFNASWDGESTFKPGALRRVDEMLGDPRLSGLAQDLALIDGFSLSELAIETASARDGGVQRQMAMIEQLATRMGGVGTPEFTQAAETIFAVTQDPTFQEAVRTLQRAKFSPGRDVAGLVGLDPDGSLYNLLSGGIDLAFTMGVDPTIMLGGASKLYKARRYGLNLNDGSTLVDAFTDIAKDPNVLRHHEQIVGALNDENIDELWRLSKSFGREGEALLTHKRVLGELGELTDGKLSVKQLHEYLISEAHNTPLLRGVGSVRGTDRYIMESWSWGREAYRGIARTARAFTDGMGDAGLHRKIEALTEGGSNLGAALPAVMRARITEGGSIIRPELYNQGAPLAYMAGQYAGAIPGMARLGEVMTSMTSMALRQPSVALNGEGAVEDIRALSKMGRAMNMPTWAQRMWADSIIAADSNATRAELVTGWFDNALTMSGVRELPEGDQLVGEVLERFRHAYGADDFLQINGRGVHAGIFLNQQADRVLMPDLGTLIKTVRAAHLARFLDVLDLGVVETAINKVWKPAVLLRLAFIPRAAGEEFLAFALRGGLGGFVQQLQAQGIAKTNVYDDIARKLALDPKTKLTEGEEWVRMQGPLANVPAYLRPVARMMSRIGWGDPMLPHLDRFGRWQRQLLDEGFGLELARPGQFARRQLDVAEGALPTGAASNLAQNVESILMGNPNSWRRMVLGGVNDDLVAASEQFYRGNATSMWRATSAVNAGPIDSGHDQRKTIRVPVEGRDGVMRTEEMMVLRGSPTMRSSSNDPYYAAAVHHNLTQATDDVLHKAAMPEIRLIKPTSLPEQTVHEVLTPFTQVQTRTGQMIMREFTDGFNNDTFKGMLDQIRRTNPHLAQHLDLNLAGLADPSFDEMLTGIRAAYMDATRAFGPTSPEASMIESVLKEMNGVAPTLRQLDGMDPDHRAFLATQIDDLLDPTSMSYDMLNDFVNGAEEALPGPANRLWRGVSTPGQFEVLPNGDLVMRGMPQDHWRPADDDVSGFGQGLSISFTANKDQAKQYATNAGDANINGMVVEVDADIVYGITGQPQQPNVSDLRFAGWGGDGRGDFGAYWFGHKGEVNVNLQDNVPKFDIDDPAVQARVDELHQQLADMRLEIAAVEQRQLIEPDTDFTAELDRLDFEEGLLQETIDEFYTAKRRILKQDSIVIPAGKWKVMENLSDPAEVAATRDIVRAKLVKFDNWFQTLTDDELEFLANNGRLTTKPADADVAEVFDSLATSWSPEEMIDTDPVNSTMRATASADRVYDLEQMAVQALAARRGQSIDEVISTLTAERPVPIEYIEEADALFSEWAEFDEIVNLTDKDEMYNRLRDAASGMDALRGTPEWDDLNDDQWAMALHVAASQVAQIPSLAGLTAVEVREQIVRGVAEVNALAFAGITTERTNFTEMVRGVRDGFNRDFSARTPLEFFDKLHGFDRPRDWGTLPATSPFYSSWEEAAPHIQRRVRDALNNPNHADSVEHSLRQLEGDPDNIVGRYRSVVSQGTRDVWTVEDEVFDKLQANTWDPTSFTYDQVLGAASDPGQRRWIRTHRPLVEQALTNGSGAIASSSRELVQALNNAAGYTGPARSISMDRTALKSTLGDPVATWGKDTEVWQITDQAAFESRGWRRSTEGDQRMTEWAELAEGRMRQLFTGRTRQGLKAKQRPGQLLEDGTQGPARPLLFHDPDARLAVSDGELITKPGTFYDHKGRLVPNGSLDYFDQGVVETSERGEIMWALYGPASRDASDSMWGRSYYIDQNNVTVRTGALEPTGDIIPAYRSQQEHVHRVGADELPSYAIGETLTMRKRGGWDRFVQWGFDKVIGPAIDSIIRNPMTFHHYSRRFIEARKGMDWLMTPELRRDVEEVGRTIQVLSVPSGVDARSLPRQIRDLAVFDGAPEAAKWTNGQAMAWMRGHSADEFDTLLQRTLTRADVRAVSPGGTASLAAVAEAENIGKAARVSARQLQNHSSAELVGALNVDSTFDDVLTYVENMLPHTALTSMDTLGLPRTQEIIRKHPVLSQLNDGEWGKLIEASNIKAHINNAAGDFAQINAINDIIPFLDSHEFKTQFAEYGKGMLPFWYAEENFMKRWVRGLIDEGPAMIRKAQLGYMGLKTAGVVRTDENGRDWFVYPGSGLLIDTINKAWPGLGTIAGGIVFQTPTDGMFPGLSSRFGQPSFTPLVTIPIDLVTAMFPELQPAQRALLGDFSSNRNVIQTLIPTTVTNFYEALTSSPESNPKYAAAVTAAIAQMDAAGQIPDNLTPMEVDKLMDRAREHGRIILFAQALTGFVAPGPPSALNAGESASFTGLGAQDPASMVRGRYLQMIRMFGIEDGTIKFLETFPDAGMADVVNPMSYTQGRTESASGAPLSSSEEALAWYDANSDYLTEFPDAGPWLLPMTEGSGRSQYAHDQIVERGLRLRVSPEEFFRSMKFKTASGDYFAMQRKYNDEIALASQEGNRERVTALTDERDYQLTIYKAAHPIFAEELQSSDGRERRSRIIEQMRTITQDPQAPAGPLNQAQIDGLRTMMSVFDDYQTRLITLGNDRSANGRAEKEYLKQQYGEFMARFTAANPKLMPFWNSVLEPESSLD